MELYIHIIAAMNWQEQQPCSSYPSPFASFFFAFLLDWQGTAIIVTHTTKAVDASRPESVLLLLERDVLNQTTPLCPGPFASASQNLYPILLRHLCLWAEIEFHETCIIGKHSRCRRGETQAYFLLLLLWYMAQCQGNLIKNLSLVLNQSRFYLSMSVVEPSLLLPSQFGLRCWLSTSLLLLLGWILLDHCHGSCPLSSNLHALQNPFDIHHLLYLKIKGLYRNNFSKAQY
jgi:hypothetical protein